MEQYTVIVGRLWMDGSFYGTSYTNDGMMFRRRRAAIGHGFISVGSDDFNIGRLIDGKLVSLDWMEETVETDPEILADVQAQCLPLPQQSET